MWNLNIWILVTIFTCTNGYDLKCPHSSHWNFTSACTEKKIYICLLNAIKSNGSKAVFTESCSPEDLARDGFKYILSPDLQQVPCAASRYQPFFFTTDGNSQCVFGKSLCKSSGQILANNGNSSIDASCRCDYRQNYDYVIPPKDPCSCKPAEEDCSCYIRKCEDDKVMIADYRCMKNVETILPENIKCPLISRILPPRETSTVYNIQMQLVTGSSTWSNQASVILIVVVIIFTVLIGILFLSVPHVTSILLKSNLKLSVKRKENEFVILNGDNVKIECHVKSYLPVRSVTWQKEIDGEIIQITQPMEKCKKDCKRPSLTIDDFNAEDQGKYRCIVRNAIGLRNEMFVSCMNYMSSVGWLARLVTVLQHIPVFHTEDMMYMTLQTYDFDSQSEPTVYNVFKGDDITMKQHFDNGQKLIAVKWFKKRDKWTELDISDKQYSGSVPDSPSLTVKETREDDTAMKECCDVQQTLVAVTNGGRTGFDISDKQYHYNQQKRITVRWYKESDKWTELDINDDQYYEGVSDSPSLTIKKTRVENGGTYFCLLIYDYGETQKALFKLKIIPQVKIYKALLQHREDKDKTYIRPAICDTIDQQLQENNIVIITGREGTGKSKFCLEFASFYEHKDYMIMKVDLSDNHTIYTDMVDTLLSIDDQDYTQDYLNAFMEHLFPVLSDRNIKVILTCRNLDLKIVRRVPEIKKLKEEVFIDIDSCLTAEEKEEMLRNYMKVKNVTSSSSVESNFRNPKIITDFSVQVTLDENAIKVIRNEEPWKGFPLCASLFCSDRKFLHLGEKYFTNPPSHLVEELKELYEAARKTSNCKDKINEYCVLVYIMNNNKHQLDLNELNLCSQLDVLYQTCFSFKIKPEKPGSNEDQKKSIEEAVYRMNNKYLKFHESVYEFIHPCLLKAMFLSSESMVHHLLQNGSLHDITEFVRSEVYTSLENELVIKIGEDYHHILCERLARHAFENHSLLLHVAEYIYSYWRLSGNNLVNKMFKHIEFILFNSLEVHTDHILSHDVGSLSENSINLEGSVQFSKIIMLLDELTYKGRDPWIYGPGSADFLVLSALISSATGRYAINREHTFTILLKEFQNRINLKSFVRLLSKPVDTHGNTFFHYLMLFGEMEATCILNVNEERQKYVLDTENLKKYTPLDIAAFLGKRNILEVLNLMTNFSKKLRDRLKRLAESGKVEYYYENSKHKNTDQPMVHQTNDDSDSPKTHEYEDADDVKKGVKDEVKKNKSIFKRKYSMRKEEPSEKEKHDKNNVLCFDDFMINIVVIGEEEDYKSIHKLLS